MPSTYTTGLRLTKQGSGENDSTWGTIANTQYDLIDDAIRGLTTVSITTGTDITLTSNNGASDESRRAILKLNGTPTANINVIVPAVSKIYVVDGSSFAGAYSVTIKPSSGTGITFKSGQNGLVICDGTNVTSIYQTASVIPTGGIIMWSGTISLIPSGWYLCDGTNGTPDLTNKFIVGASQDNLSTAMTNVTGSLTQTGGDIVTGSDGGETVTSASHVLTVDEIPAHHHAAGNGDDSWNMAFGYANGGYPGPYTTGASQFTSDTGGGQGHTHGVTTSDHTHSNLPPYYALAFIMKG